MKKSFKKIVVFGVVTAIAATGMNFISGRNLVSAANSYIMGDVDADGKVTLLDAKASLRAALGISETGIRNIKAHDVNSDGKYTIQDTKIILQLALGMGSLDEILNRPELTAPPVKTAAPTNNPGTSGGSNESYARRVLDLVNAERAKYNLSALSWDVTLASAAQTRAVETISSFSHTRPNGSSCFTILDEYNISYMGCGENIAWGQSSPEQVMDSWMNSPGHRANILNADYTKLGVGCVQNSGRYYWTQMFIY